MWRTSAEGQATLLWDPKRKEQAPPHGAVAAPNCPIGTPAAGPHALGEFELHAPTQGSSDAHLQHWISRAFFLDLLVTVRRQGTRPSLYSRRYPGRSTTINYVPLQRIARLFPV